jgi:hypothetical protein
MYLAIKNFNQSYSLNTKEIDIVKKSLEAFDYKVCANKTDVHDYLQKDCKNQSLADLLQTITDSLPNAKTLAKKDTRFLAIKGDIDDVYVVSTYQAKSLDLILTETHKLYTKKKEAYKFLGKKDKKCMISEMKNRYEVCVKAIVEKQKDASIEEEDDEEERTFLGLNDTLTVYNITKAQFNTIKPSLVDLKYELFTNAVNALDNFSLTHPKSINTMPGIKKLKKDLTTMNILPIEDEKQEEPKAKENSNKIIAVKPMNKIYQVTKANYPQFIELVEKYKGIKYQVFDDRTKALSWCGLKKDASYSKMSELEITLSSNIKYKQEKVTNKYLAFFNTKTMYSLSTNEYLSIEDEIKNTPNLVTKQFDTKNSAFDWFEMKPNTLAMPGLKKCKKDLESFKENPLKDILVPSYLAIKDKVNNVYKVQNSNNMACYLQPLSGVSHNVFDTPSEALEWIGIKAYSNATFDEYLQDIKTCLGKEVKIKINKEDQSITLKEIPLEDLDFSLNSKTRKYLLWYILNGGDVKSKGTFKGKVLLVRGNDICFGRLYTKFEDDGDVVEGKEDHVWVLNAKEFLEMGVENGDCFEFNALSYPYRRNDGSIDFALKAPTNIKKIDDYNLASREMLVLQSAKKLTCMTCIYGDYCDKKNCIAPSNYREKLTKSLLKHSKQPIEVVQKCMAMGV